MVVGILEEASLFIMRMRVYKRTWKLWKGRGSQAL